MPSSPEDRAQHTIGIDIGDRHCHYCIIDAAGAQLDAGRFPTTAAAFKKRFQQMPAACVALEVGTHSPWITEQLTDYGHQVLVANARKLRMIYQADSKTDRLDAEKLARVARMDPQLLAPITHRGRAVRADLTLLRARDALVRNRTSSINYVRGAVKAFGTRLHRCAVSNFHRTAAEQLPPALAPALLPVLGTIEQLTTQIRGLTRQIVQLGKERYPEAAHLQQVPGVGPITALRFVLTIEDPARFRNSRAVGAYLGLRPRQGQSGDHNPQLRITKAGDQVLRWLLVQCAHYILGSFGPDCYLRRHGLALASVGGRAGKKRALVAIARKLAVLLHRLWVTGEIYDPWRNAPPGARPTAA